MIKIITDTGSDITAAEASARGIVSLALDIKFENNPEGQTADGFCNSSAPPAYDNGDAEGFKDVPYEQLSDIEHNKFYRELVQSKTLPTTSQCSPAQFLEHFNAVKESGDEAVVIALSSGLSGTYSSALLAKQMCDYEGITVVDSLSATIGQRLLVHHAVKLRGEGKTRTQIAEAITELRSRLVVFGMLDTLTYLKKGGRIPPALAVIGNALQIKPLIMIQNTDGKLGQIGKVRGYQAGKRILSERFEKYTRDESIQVYFGYSQDKARGEEFMNEIAEKYNLKDAGLYQIGGVIGTHLGPGVLEIGFVEK